MKLYNIEELGVGIKSHLSYKDQVGITPPLRGLGGIPPPPLPLLPVHVNDITQTHSHAHTLIIQMLLFIY